MAGTYAHPYAVSPTECDLPTDRDANPKARAFFEDGRIFGATSIEATSRPNARSNLDSNAAP